MRTTLHNGRTDSHGKVYTTKHNDRNFTADADHINRAETGNNIVWKICGNAPTIDDNEHAYYLYAFGAGLEARNARYRKQRHEERVRTIDEYRANPRSCPEEVITQIGSRSEHTDARTLWGLWCEQERWERKRYPNVRYLDAALHLDEDGAAPHIHARRVWIAHDPNGNPVVSEAGALREMGIQRPDPTKKVSRYNNSKITYTRECREHWQQLCREHGLEIDTEPREPGKAGLSLMQLKAATATQEREQAQEQAAQAQKAQQAAEQATQAAQQQERQAKKQARDTLDAVRAGKAAVSRLEAEKGALQDAGPTDLSEFHRTLRGRYTLTEDQLRDLVATRNAHASVAAHAADEQERIAAEEQAARDRIKYDQTAELRKAKAAYDKLFADFTDLRGFVDDLRDRLPVVAKLHDLWRDTFVRPDVFADKSRADEAKDAYQAALDRLQPRSGGREKTRNRHRADHEEH